MLKKRIVNKEVEEIVDILCNKCGKSCIADSGGCVNRCGLIEASVHGNYSSPKLWDDVVYTFSICEECLRELFDNFEIHPNTKGGGLVCHGDREYETKEMREKNRVKWDKKE